MRNRMISTALALCLGAGLLGISARPASAGSEDTWRLATYGAAGVTAYGLFKKKPIIAIAGAAGAYLAYRKWKGEVNDRHDRERTQGRRSVTQKSTSKRVRR